MSIGNPVSKQLGRELRDLDILSDPHSGFTIDDKTSEMSIKEYISKDSSDPLGDILAKFNSRTTSYFGVQLRFTFASGTIGIPAVGVFIGKSVPVTKKMPFLGDFTRVAQETRVYEKIFIDGLDDDLVDKACEIGKGYERTPIEKYNGKAVEEVQGKYRYK